MLGIRMHSENGPARGPKELISHGMNMNIATHATAPEDVCEWDYEVKIVKSIGEFPSRIHPTRGSVFAIAKIRIMNKGKVPISTSEKSWELIADGKKHPARAGVRDKNLHYVETDVIEGQDVTTELVFEIPSTAKDVRIGYVGMGGYSLEHEPSLLHPVGKQMVCPNCGKQMETGFLGMEKMFSDIAWFHERTILGMGGESLGLKDKMGMVYADAYRCKYCGFVMIKY
jgi:predicted RNA-binding Zn-ribbon protein involved in translation (DUF1610 family)